MDLMFSCLGAKEMTDVVTRFESDRKVHPHILMVFKEILQSFMRTPVDDDGVVYFSVDTSGWDQYRPEIKRFVESFESVPSSMLENFVGRVLAALRLWLWGVEVRDGDDFCECVPAVPIFQTGTFRDPVIYHYLIPVGENGVPVCFCNNEDMDDDAILQTHTMKVFPDEATAVKYISCFGMRFFRFEY